MNIYELIKKHEATRARMYKDSRGIETIGIGHNLRDKPISNEAIEQIFQDDLYGVIGEVSQSFTWYTDLNEVRQAVILDMVFNMGLAGFKLFTKTIKFLANGEYTAASIEMMDSLWSSQVGSRADTLSNMLRTGEW